MLYRLLGVEFTWRSSNFEVAGQKLYSPHSLNRKVEPTIVIGVVSNSSYLSIV